MAKRNTYYDALTLEHQKKYFSTLPEKQRRHFVAMEYIRLGRGSQRYLSEIFGCARQVIVNGTKEILSPSFDPDYKSQRRAGGGRKKKNSL
jgi:hypothetical protein